MKMNLAAENDNRPRIEADFRLPDLFWRTYSSELLGWASDLQTQGRMLEIALWNRPGATILSPGYQGKVMLRCEEVLSSVRPVLTLIVQPDSPQDEAHIRLHCEALPRIMHDRREEMAELDHLRARGMVRAVFNLPEYFVKRYGFELREWGRNFSKIGMVKTIVLREGVLSDMSPDPEQGAVLLGVKLRAVRVRLKNDEMMIEISPASEQDERVIANHVQKMTEIGIPARAELVEPPRPGMPFMPTIAGAKRHPDGGV